MKADTFVNPQTLLIMLIGLAAFIFDTAAGVLFAKLLNLFTKEKVNPMIGAAGISAFPWLPVLFRGWLSRKTPATF